MSNRQKIIHDRVAYQVTISEGDYYASEKDDVIIVNATSNCRVFLPTASGIEGRLTTVSRLDGSNNLVEVLGIDFQKINNADSFFLTAQFMVVTFEAVNFSVNSTNVPGYYIRDIFEPQVVREEFTAVLDFNREKVAFGHIMANTAYTVSTKPKRYGKVIMHELESMNDAVVTFPQNFRKHGVFLPNARNLLTFVAVPDVTGDMISVTITQEGGSAAAATDVHVMGTIRQGQTVTAMYTFSPAGEESGTTFQWYRADNNSGLNQEPSTGTGISRTITSADFAKGYIRVGVTPRTVNGTGVETFSPWYGPVLAP